MILSPLAEAQRRRVVLADDDEFHAEVVSMWLGMQGFEVVRFPSGDALLEWARSGDAFPVAAILLDVEMPGRDGFTTFAELRRIEAFTATPALLVSGMCPQTLQERSAALTVPSLRKDGDLLPRLVEWLSQSALVVV